jgi:hypothetical protein
MWDLWWTEWHWDKFVSEYFDFPLPVSFHQRSIFIFVLFLPERQTDKSLATFQKAVLFRKSGSIGWSTFIVFFRRLTALYCQEKLRTRLETANTNCVGDGGGVAKVECCQFVQSVRGSSWFESFSLLTPHGHLTVPRLTVSITVVTPCTTITNFAFYLHSVSVRCVTDSDLPKQL